VGQGQPDRQRQRGQFTFHCRQDRTQNSLLTGTVRILKAGRPLLAWLTRRGLALLAGNGAVYDNCAYGSRSPPGAAEAGGRPSSGGDRGTAGTTTPPHALIAAAHS